MIRFPRISSRIASLALAAAVAAPLALATGACGKKGSHESATGWLDNPTEATKIGDTKLYWEPLGLLFETPDTLYVFKECGELGHKAEGENGWIPILACSSVTDPDASEFDEGQPEQISIKFYATKKTRPLDERTVTWFENQYKQAGFRVDDISYQHSFQNKAGIYAKLQVVDKSSGLPTREILQFMFPRRDVVFIARVEYPFGDSRSIETDWKYILWNFELDPTPEDLQPTTEPT